MLLHEERGPILESLASAVADGGKGIILVILGNEGRPLWLQLPVGESFSPQELASRLLNFCVAKKWPSTPPSLLELLLDYLVTTKGFGEHAATLERVRAGIDPNPSPYEERWLAAGGPFFGRPELRTKVRLLIEGTPFRQPTILRIKSVADSYGRTYSQYLFQHVKTRAGEPGVLFAEPTPETGPTYKVTDLALDLAGPLGKTDVPAPSGSSYPTALARWVLATAADKGGRWIIVIGGLGQAGVDPGVREMVGALASMIVSQYRDWMRLVLLDFAGDLPTLAPAEVVEEVLPLPGAITAADLVPCIEAADKVRLANAFEGLPAEGVPAFAEAMIAAVPATGKQRLVQLNAKLTSLAFERELPA